MNPAPTPRTLGREPPPRWWEWLGRLGEGTAAPPPPAGLAEVLLPFCRSIPDPVGGAAAVGRPCPLPAALWHGQQLCDLLGAGVGDSPAVQARLAYHGRWILRLVAPADPRWRALVSVVIPVFNRAELVCEAIGSALAQSHEAVEVIVVDDGSTDDLMARLRVFGDRIRLLRQPQQGVARARNLGLGVARGDYVNFLDSDDLLDPGWLEAAVGALATIADADLLYAPPRQEEPPRPHSRTALLKYQPLRGGPLCPSRALLPVTARRHPFLMLGVVLCRWRALELGGFDPSLTRGEDTRFWFRLGLANAKVIGLGRLWNERRRLPSGLSATAPPETDLGVKLINLADLLEGVEHWPHVPAQLEAFVLSAEWRALETTTDEGFLRAGRLVEARLADLPAVGLRHGHSPTPVLQAIRQLARALPRLCRRPAASLPLAERLARVAEEALARCAPCTEADRRLWLGDGAPPPLAADTLLTLALMRQGHWWHLEPPPPPFWQDLQRALRSIPSALLPSPLPHGVIGRPAPLPPLPFHRNALARLCRSSPSDPARHRLAYHADWLLSLLSPDPGLSPHTTSAPPGGPLVSVLIPVFNRADTIAEAVASCLDQTYPHLEVLVIDDASTEDIAAALQPFLPRIRLLRQHPNRGAGAARNLAITQASGSLLHFLDADDLLEPDAIARKIEALHAIPDADLVFSGARQTGESAQEAGLVLHYLQPPPRARHCPTQCLLETASRHYPILTSTVLVARWRLIESGPFEADLRRGEDEELFLRLALLDAKAVGINSLSSRRRISRRSLSAARPGELELARFHLHCLIALLEAPRPGRRLGGRLIRRHLKSASLPLLVKDPAPASERLRQALGAALRGMAEEAAAGSPSARGLLARWRRRLTALLFLHPDIAWDPWVRALVGLCGEG